MKMNLNDLPEYFTEADTALFDKTLEDFEKNAKANGEQQQRILSSVMRKAGFEMKENITVKRTKKSKKRMIGFIVAAAVALTGAIGTYAYNQFINRNTVERFIDNADTLEENGYVENQVIENEHLRITLDAVLADDYNACIVFTEEALDDVGYEFLHDYVRAARFRYADNREQIFMSTLTSGEYDPDDSRIVRNYAVYDLSGVDTERDIEMIFFGFKGEHFVTGDPIPTGEYGIPQESPLGDDMIGKVNFSRNCEAKKFTSPDGREIFLSQFEIFTTDVSFNYPYADNMQMIRNDGTIEVFDKSKSELHEGRMYNSEKEITEDRNIIFIGRFIDINDYSGFVVDGVEYTAD